MSARNTKQELISILHKIQRDNLAEVVACRTEDKSLYELAKEYEVKVEAMDENANFLPILTEIGEKIGFNR